MFIRKRRHFSLIELLVVLTIIALVAGAVGINSQKAMRHQRFQSEVSEFADRLRLAQNLMLISDADVHVKVESTPSGINYHIETDAIFPKSFDKFIKKIGTLKSVHHLSHIDGHGGKIDLRFLSKGDIMTQGNLQFSTNDKAFIADIMLTGAPGAISTDKKKEDNEKSVVDVTRLMIQEIQMVNNENKITP